MICIKDKSVPWPSSYHKGYQLLYHQSHPLEKILYLLFSGYMWNTWLVLIYILYLAWWWPYNMLSKCQLKIRKHGPQQDSSMDLLFYNGSWQHTKHEATILMFSIMLSWINCCTNMTVTGQVASRAVMLIECFSWFKLPCWFSVGFKFSKGITKLIEKEQKLISLKTKYLQQGNMSSCTKMQ